MVARVQTDNGVHASTRAVDPRFNQVVSLPVEIDQVVLRLDVIRRARHRDGLGLVAFPDKTAASTKPMAKNFTPGNRVVIEEYLRRGNLEPTADAVVVLAQRPWDERRKPL